MVPRTLSFAAALISAWLVLATPAQAHDTWFRALPAPDGGRLLALGTGERFPVQQSAIGAEYLERQGCVRVGTSAFMRPLRHDDTALVLDADPRAGTCWAQLVPLHIELAPDKVALYLREIQASASVREAWAAQQVRGLAWHERYTKHARIDFGVAAGQPAPLAMDVVRERADAGGTTFRVWRDGAPLSGQPMELIGEASALGLWRRSDAEGRIHLPALPPGHWVLRGTDLRPADDAPGHWDSRFVTLAFEVAAPGPATPSGRLRVAAPSPASR